MQVYASQQAEFRTPLRSLVAFKRIRLEPGASRTIELLADNRQLALTDPSGKQALRPGDLTLSIGGSQPDAQSVALLGRAPLSVTLTIEEGRLRNDRRKTT